MTKPFDRAFEFVHEWEGGSSLSDDPSDPGGITRHGISFQFLRSIDQNATEADIEALTVAKARAIYLEHFWQALCLDELPSVLALLMFDTAVNVGTGRTVRWLQQCFPSQLRADGLLGPLTIKVLNRRLSLDYFVLDLISQIILLRRRFHYAKLAARNAWARRFLNGWLNRVDALEIEIASIRKEEAEA